MQIKPGFQLSTIEILIKFIHKINRFLFLGGQIFFRNILRYMLSKYKLSQIIISTHCLSYII